MIRKETKQIKLKPKVTETKKKPEPPKTQPQSVETRVNIASSVNRLFVVLTGLLFSLFVIITVYFIVNEGVEETKKGVNNAVSVIDNKIEKEVGDVKKLQEQGFDSLTPVLRDLNTTLSNDKKLDTLTKYIKYIKKNMRTNTEGKEIK